MNYRTVWLLATVLVIIALVGFLVMRKKTDQAGPAVTNQSFALSGVCNCWLVYESFEGNAVKTYAVDLQTRQRRAISYGSENRLDVFPSPDSRHFVSLTSNGTKLLLWSSTFEPTVVFEVLAGQYIVGYHWSTDGSTVAVSIGAGTDYESASAAPLRVVAVDITTRAVKSLFTKDDIKTVTQKTAWGVLGVADHASAMILSSGTRESGESFWQWLVSSPSFRSVNTYINGSVYSAIDSKNEQIVWLDHDGLKKLNIRTLKLSSIPITTQSDSPMSRPNGDGRVMVITPSDQAEAPALQSLDLQTDSMTPLGSVAPSSPSGLAGSVWTPDGQALLDFDADTQQFFDIRLDGKSKVFKDTLLGNSPTTWMLLEKTP